MTSIAAIFLGGGKAFARTEEMLGFLQANGYDIVGASKTAFLPADILLVNTIAFIESSAQLSESYIRNALVLKQLGQYSKIIVTGGLVQRDGTLLFTRFPEIDSIISNNVTANIIEAINKNGSYLQPPARVFPWAKVRYPITPRHTAYILIGRGCNNCCGYCIIPKLNGRYCSKPLEDIIAEATALVANGVREITLVAQDTTSWGIDLYKSRRLIDLLKALTKVAGLDWIHISYAYPKYVTEELLQVMAESPKFCHSLDIPFQHISDNILKNMGRMFGTGTAIREKIKLIRRYMPDIALYSTVIVGSPDETEDDFKTLKDFVIESNFYRLGCFSYSPEKNTKTATLQGQITDDIKELRRQELINAWSQTLVKNNKQKIGKKVSLLMDSPRVGRTQYEEPDVGGVILDTDCAPGQFMEAEIIDIDSENKQSNMNELFLRGKYIKSKS